eukprot:g1003.t1
MAESDAEPDGEDYGVNLADELVPKPSPLGPEHPHELDLTLKFDASRLASDSEDEEHSWPAARGSDDGRKRRRPLTREERIVQEQRVLSPLERANKQQIQQHLVRLRAGVIFRYLMPLLQRYLNHTLNRNLFNEPVNEKDYPDYRKVIDKPIDLGTVKQKLQALLYEDERQFCNDVRAVFANAQKYNPAGNQVHQNAARLAQEFEQDFTKVMVKARQKQQQQQHHGHDCDLCRGNECPLCGEKCLKFEPPVLPCAGTCGLNIRRTAIYYMSADGYRFWCQRCFNALPQEVPPPMVTKGAQNQNAIRKRDLVRKTHSAQDTGEPWVQCDFCRLWMHQACALFSLRKNLLAPQPTTIQWKCPLCRLADLTAAEEVQAGDGSPAATADPMDTGPPTGPGPGPGTGGPTAPTVKFQLKPPPTAPAADAGSAGEPPDGPAPPASPAAPPFPPAPDADSSSLPPPTVAAAGGGTGARAPVLEAIPWGRPLGSPVNRRATPRSLALVSENFVRGPRDTRASTLPRTFMSSFLEDRVFDKLHQIGHHSICASLTIRVVCAHDLAVSVHPLVRQHFVRRDGEQFGKDMKYRSKAICLFQKLDGIDVCLFSMFVQEYGDECGPPSRRCVYIAYIDSVAYFRPRKVRTVVYHELVAAYFEYVRRRGFHTAHIWSSPPQRGNTYIFWCHPPHQRTPGKERLCQWYHSLLNKAIKERKILGVSQMYDNYFKREDAPFPPYFEGDFWPTEVERLGLMPLAKRKKLQLKVQLDMAKAKEAETRLEAKAEAAADALTSAIAGTSAAAVTAPAAPGADGAAPAAASSSSSSSSSSSAPSARWLHVSVRDAVAEMKDFFLTVHLQYQCNKCQQYIVQGSRWHSAEKGVDLCGECYEEEKARAGGAAAMAGFKGTNIKIKELSSATSDPDAKTLEAGNESFTSAGKLFLKLCEFRHQFDTLRRAKYSTMLMLQYLHHVAEPKVYAYSCNELDGEGPLGKRVKFGASYGAHGDGQRHVLSLYHRGRQRFPWRRDGEDEDEVEEEEEEVADDEVRDLKTDHPDVGRTVKLIWPEDNTFYPATVVAVGQDPKRGSDRLLHRVEYLDGGEQETVDLSKEQHEWD